MSTPRDVVVTGAGVVCALADRREVLFDALRAGRTAFVPPTLVPAEVAAGHVTAEIGDFAAERYLGSGNVRPLDRAGRLALVAVEQALASSGWPVEARDAAPVGVVVGTMFCGVRTIGEFDRRAQVVGPEYASPLDFSNTVLNAAAGQVAIWHRLRGVNATIAAGAASGLEAIAYAAQLVRAGRADVLVAGGADELCFESFLGFARGGRLAQPGDDGAPGFAVPFDARRTGAVLGEGAAFLVLEAAPTAAARGASILGRIAGAASGFDPDALAENDVDPRALEWTIRRALRQASIAPGEVGLVSAGACGSPRLDRGEAAALEPLVGRNVPVTAIKAMTGELLGASGPIQLIAALDAMRAGEVPGIAGLRFVDPCVRLDIAAATRPVDASWALVTAVTPEGNCSALVAASD